MAGDVAVSRNPKPAISRRMSAAAAAIILVGTHGNVKAHRQAQLEQQNARRARSRKRFAFWVAVASAIQVPDPQIHVQETKDRAP